MLNEAECEHAAAMRKALSLYASTSFDFADCVFYARHSEEGVPVLTFDKKLARAMERAQ